MKIYRIKHLIASACIDNIYLHYMTENWKLLL